MVHGRVQVAVPVAVCEEIHLEAKLVLQASLVQMQLVQPLHCQVPSHLVIQYLTKLIMKEYKCV